MKNKETNSNGIAGCAGRIEKATDDFVLGFYFEERNTDIVNRNFRIFNQIASDKQFGFKAN